MDEQTGGFGTISYDGNRITVDAEPDTIGDVSLTYGGGRVQCFWDGTQWVCVAIGFVADQGQGQAA